MMYLELEDSLEDDSILSLTVWVSSLMMDDWFELMRFAGFEQHGLGLVCKGGRSILQGTLSSFGWQVDF